MTLGRMQIFVNAGMSMHTAETPVPSSPVELLLVLLLAIVPLLPGATVLVFRRRLAALINWVVPERLGGLRRLVRIDSEKQRVAVWIVLGCGWLGLGLMISVIILIAAFS